MNRFLQICFNACLLTLTAGIIHAGELKVDINRDGKNSLNTTATGYTQWTTSNSGGTTISGTTPITQSFYVASSGETITVSLAMTAAAQSAGGLGLTYTYYATGSTTEGQKLVSDGVSVDPRLGNAGGQIQMTITGLAAGEHSLLTFHNVGDSPADPSLGSLSPTKIYLNGAYVTSVTPSIRSTDVATPTAYLNFTTTSTSDVTTVLFAADTSSAATTKNVVLNGFEIDTPNSVRIANSPVPVDGDEHVDADSGNLNLQWSPAIAGGVVSHDVYFGTNQAAVKDATHASPEFKGNQTTTNFTATGLNSMLTYYWRVDEIDSIGNATKGTVWMFRPRHLAFPGAEGYGRFARGGRGGVVVEVTNLNDSGPGSLRDALTGNYGPRTVVFDVSGLITLQSPLTIDSSHPYITVAGQTAPGKGICVKNYVFGMSGARDVIFRDMRIRVGKDTGLTQNASGMAGVDNCIMDHCSISWGIDEEISSRGSKNFTLQRTLISEALNIAGHQNYPPGTEHGYAASVGGDIGSLHHNLLAHNEGRNWSLAGGLDASGYYAGRLDIFNNVVYNWGHRATDGGAHEVNFVNNYYKPGAGTDFFYALNAQYDGFPGTQQYYFAGNVMPGHFQVSNETAGREATDGNGTVPTSYSPWVNAPFFPSYATIDEVTNAYKKVLSDVGCTEPVVDDHDVRVIRETIDGTYTYTGTGPYGGRPGMPNSTDDVGGWEDYGNAVRPAGFDTDHDGLPNWWEQIKGLSTNSPSGDFSDANADLVGDGYTELERYINWMAEPHVDCNVGSYVDIDLAALSRGFTNNSPRYAVFSAVNGTVVTNGNGRTARFTSTVSTNALGGFTFSVVDANGYTMTNTVGVHISSVAANSAPVFTTTASDRTINVGVSLLITNTATDADAGQTLSYSLPTKPANAVINGANGILSWRPEVGQANTTNLFSVVVADNGSPSMSATQTFNVVVNPLAMPSVSDPQIGGGQIGLTINGQVGPDYAVQGSTNLVDWTTLLITNPATMPFSWSTNAGSLPAQYYRIKVGPPLP